MTVVWHVDDLKVSHMDAEEVEKFIQQMEETFGKDTPLPVSRGQVHDYLGMTLDFRNKGEVLTESRQPLQVQSHLEMPRILVQLGHIQHT